MLRITDKGVEHRDPVRPSTEIVVPRRKAIGALENCVQAVAAAGMLPSLSDDLARLRQFIETH